MEVMLTLASLVVLVKGIFLFWLLLLTVAFLRWDLVEFTARIAVQQILTRKIGTSWRCDKMVCARNHVEFQNVIVANGPGVWEAPYSLRIKKLYIQFRLIGWISLWPQLTAGHYRIGPLELTAGFRVKEMEAADYEGIELYLEDAETNVDTSVFSVLKQSTMLKAPQSGFGRIRRRVIVLEASRILWYEVGATTPRGTLKLAPSSSVERRDDEEPNAEDGDESVGGVLASGGQMALPPTPVRVHSNEHGHPFTVISGKQHVTLIASSAHERDEWSAAIERAVANLKSGGGGVAPLAWSSNSEWIERFFDEIDGDKTRKKVRTERRRREWRRRWLLDAEGGAGAAADRSRLSSNDHGDDDDNLDADEIEDEDGLDMDASDASATPEARRSSSGRDSRNSSESPNPARLGRPSPRNMRELRSSLFAERHTNGAEFLKTLSEQLTEVSSAQSRALQGSLHSLAHQGTKWVENKLSAQSEARVEEAVEWCVGRLSVHGLVVILNQQQRLTLNSDGWVLRGFVGSESELRARIMFVQPVGAGLGSSLDLGLAAKLLRDSGAAVAAAKGAELRAKTSEAMSKGAETLAKGAEAMAKSAEAAAAAARLSLDKTAAELEKTAAELTSKVGDELEKTANELKSKVEETQDKIRLSYEETQKSAAENVRKWTGKETYHFGDLSKATWTRLMGVSAVRALHDSVASPTRSEGTADEHEIEKRDASRARSPLF